MAQAQGGRREQCDEQMALRQHATHQSEGREVK
jgi:hypothetical protein